jgi:hypothetical protein
MPLGDDCDEKATQSITTQMDQLKLGQQSLSPTKDFETCGFGIGGSEKRRCEDHSDDEMVEELKDTVGAYPQSKSTFAQKVRISTMIGKVTGD